MSREAHTAGQSASADWSVLRLAGYPLTDLSACLGTLCWVSLALSSFVDSIAGRGVALTVVELFVAFALLSLVPVGLGLIDLPADARLAGLSLRVAVGGQFPAAGLAVAGLTAPVESLVSIGLVLPWVGVTGTIAVAGLARLNARGLRPLPALAIDAATLYLPVGAVALVCHRAQITFHFAPIIVLLTVVHYHYAGFVLPLVAGRAGAVVAEDGTGFAADPLGRLGAAATVAIIVNLALIAVGITFSPLVEVVAVGLFTVAVAGFAAVVLTATVPVLPRVPAVLLGGASLVLFVTMALALAYGFSAFSPNASLLTVREMVLWHGTLNAVGFALPALVAFRLVDGGR